MRHAFFKQNLYLQQSIMLLVASLIILFGFSQPLKAQNLNTQVLSEQALSEQVLSEQVLLSYIAKQKFSKTNPTQLFNPTKWQMRSTPPTINSEQLSSWLVSSYAPTAERIKQSSNERQCLAQAIYHEARGEPEQGQWAVVNVILNRVVSKSYPPTICGVVFQNASKQNYRCQFTFACDGRANGGGEGNRIVRTSWVRSNIIALAAYRQFLQGERPNILPDSALFYHTTAVSPSWAQVYKVVAQIGNHIFYAPS